MISSLSPSLFVRGIKICLAVVLVGLAGGLGACGGGGGGGSPAAPAVQLMSIAVTPASPSVAAGLTVQLVAEGSYSDGTKQDLSAKVTWASSNAAVATFSGTGGATGLATTVAMGSATITATSGAIVGNDTVTVTAATLVSVTITPTNPTIAPNKPLQFTATGKYTDGKTQDMTTAVTWNSLDPTVATIGSTSGLAQSLGVAGTVSTTISAMGVTGTPVIPPVTLTVSPTVYAYATNFDDNTVSQYVIGTGGALTPLSPLASVTAGKSPFSVSVEPTGQYVYVANWGDNTVSEYTIGTGGGLTPVGTGTVATGNTPNAVTIDPADRHAYVANYGEDTVSQYTIGAGGALVPMSTPKVAAGSNPSSVTIHPNGLYAYVANYAAGTTATGPGASTISQYTVGADGSLTPMNPATVASGIEPNSVVIDPTGHFAYVANAGSNNVSQYIIGAGGVLTPMPQPMVPAGARPFAVTVVPSGKYVYVANTDDGTISQYTADLTTGALTAMTPATVFSGSGLASHVSFVAIDPTGKYAYATNRGESTLSQFTIGSTGALMPMTPSSTVPAGLHPSSIATGY